MRELRQMIYGQALAAGLTNTTVATKAARLADDAMKEFDARFPSEDVLDERMQELRRSNDACNQEIIRLNGELSKRDDKIDELTREVNESAEKLAQRFDQVAELGTSNEQLRGVVEQLEAQLAAAQPASSDVPTAGEAPAESDGRTARAAKR